MISLSDIVYCRCTLALLGRQQPWRYHSWGIPTEIEKEIRARDKRCVFCHKRFSRESRASIASIEHFNNNRPMTTKYNLAICCGSCNSSKLNKKLLAWLKTPYCRERQINEKTVAKPVKEYIRRVRGATMLLRKKRRKAGGV